MSEMFAWKVYTDFAVIISLLRQEASKKITWLKSFAMIKVSQISLFGRRSYQPFYLVLLVSFQSHLRHTITFPKCAIYIWQTLQVLWSLPRKWVNQYIFDAFNLASIGSSPNFQNISTNILAKLSPVSYHVFAAANSVVATIHSIS